MGGKERKGKGEKKERKEREKRKKRKEKEKKERKRKEVDSFFLSTLAFQRSELVEPGSKVRRFDEGLRFKRWGFFLLLFTSSLWVIVFGLILEPCCVMLMVWDGFVACLKGCF